MRARLVGVYGWFSCILVVNAALAADDQLVTKLAESCNRHLAAGRYAEAEADARQLVAWTEQASPPQLARLATIRCRLSNILRAQGHYAQAESLVKRALAAQERIEPVGAVAGVYLDELGYLYCDQARYVEAEAVFQRALKVWEKVLPAQSDFMAEAWRNLGGAYSCQGRYAEAEPLFKRALEINKAVAGNNLDVATSYSALASLYVNQGRFGDAEPLLKAALGLHEKRGAKDGSGLSRALNDLAWSYALDGRYAEAEPLARRSLAIGEKTRNPALAQVLDTLAFICFKTGRNDEADKYWMRVQTIFETSMPQGHPDAAIWLNNYARLYVEQGRFQEAEPLADRAVAISERGMAPSWVRFDSYSLRAVIAWRLGHRDDAIADIERAMELAEQARGQSAGAEHERAGTFARFSSAFEMMVAWQVQLGDAAKALAAMERGRARSLLDEMNMGGAELQIGRSADERERVRKREGELQRRIAELEKRLSLAVQQGDAASTGDRSTLEAELAKARQALYDHYRDQRSSSPVYRNLLAVGAGPPRLSQIRRRLVREDGLVLAYLLGGDGGYVLAIGPKEARLTALAVDAQAAKMLDIERGPLTAGRFRAVCSNEAHTGVVQQLARPDTAPAATARLAVLYNLLIPAVERKAIAAGEVKRLIVVPDGALALLPFEALVVEHSKGIRYLLDAGPPIVYTPSATVLYNLADRPPARGQAGAADQPVLTVADPVYGDVAAPANRPVELLAARNRYSEAGGALADLPFSGEESNWVAEAFIKRQIAVGALRGGLATEYNVRGNVAGRRLLHFACHGLADQAYGNFFGCLALTPGTKAASNPVDDGFLMLPEIYELNLKSCELAILSACQTNYGPQQKGEGVWALSRGFLVAGARRVVASNWLVDDEAAASLISVFCSDLAKAQGKGEVPDYAAALHRAKRWSRGQEKWASPYYWGTFVLVGPN